MGFCHISPFTGSLFRILIDLNSNSFNNCFSEHCYLIVCWWSKFLWPNVLKSLPSLLLDLNLRVKALRPVNYCGVRGHREELRSLLTQSSLLLLSPLAATPHVRLFFLRWDVASFSEPDPSWTEPQIINPHIQKHLSQSSFLPLLPTLLFMRARGWTLFTVSGWSSSSLRNNSATFQAEPLGQKFCSPSKNRTLMFILGSLNRTVFILRDIQQTLLIFSH